MLLSVAHFFSCMHAAINSKRAWAICLVTGLFFFYEFFQLNLLDILNPYLRKEFHLDASSFSFLSSIFLWANLLFLIPAGIVIDRYSVKRVILLFLFFCILGVALMLFTNTMVGLVVGRFLTGMSNAFCFLSAVLLVSRWFSSQRQGLVMGLVVTIGFIGGMLAHAPIAYLLKSISWKQILWLDLGLGGVIFGLIALVVLDAPTGFIKSTAHPHKPWWQAFSAVLKVPETFLAGLYISLLNLPMMVLCALWGMSYLEVVHQMPAMVGTYIISALFIGSIIGCPVLGFLSDFYKTRKRVMWFGIVGSLLSLLPLCTGGQYSWIVLTALFLMVGFFSSAQVLGYPLIAESHLPAQVGEATGVASLLVMGGAALGQMGFGFLMQQHALMQTLAYTPSDFQYAMWMFPLALIIAAIALYKIRETL